MIAADERAETVAAVDQPVHENGHGPADAAVEHLGAGVFAVGRGVGLDDHEITLASDGDDAAARGGDGALDRKSVV